MSRRVETLDDLIDRVAASLTQAPQDSSFGERVAAGLDGGRVFPPWMRAAALAALIAAVAGVSLIRLPSSDRHIVRTTPAPAVPSTSQDTENAVNQQPPAPAAKRVARAEIARLSRGRVEPSSAIPPLASPSALSLDEVMPDALSVPAVEIEALDVSLIAIDDLTFASEAKEQP